ncbi:hypothetical protein GCM10011575_21060 [Microlunatus endophyticus]|uniref:Transcriptional regulator n=1 Tax=Microlunatus endophyticus TaxID=1716077 RepID=A0A917S984_9ACTN|nr:hypothetical protein [Microlunatus endophyticus]GGL62288.1 hypothetical protein GCM10011575_21060 [Microlunatus endophyticus]
MNTVLAGPTHTGGAVRVDGGYLSGGDGGFDAEQTISDRPAGPGRDLDYRLTDEGETFLADIEVRIPQSRRPLIRYCVDWTETRHHLAGALGRGIRDRFLEAGWVTYGPAKRTLTVTPDGERALGRHFGLRLDS